MCSGSEAGSYLRLIDSSITQLKVQGPSGTCNESKEEAHTAHAAPHTAHLEGANDEVLMLADALGCGV